MTDGGAPAVRIRHAAGDACPDFLEVTMKRKYTVEISCTVFMDPALAKGQAARDHLGSHVQVLSFVGEVGGKLGNVGDADHLAAMMDACDTVGKQVVRAAVAKAHHHLISNYPDVQGDHPDAPEDIGGTIPAAPGSEREQAEREARVSEEAVGDSSTGPDFEMVEE